MSRSHPRCWTGDRYVHTCHVPSGRPCADCDRPAGTPWGPVWCPDCDVIRLDRCSAGFDSFDAAFDEQRDLMAAVRATTENEEN